MALLDRLFNCKSRRHLVNDTCILPDHLINDPLNREEDGFLLIGQTATERTTVSTNQFEQQNIQADLPPSYDSQVSLPTYMEACHMDSSRTSILQRSQSFPVTAKTPTAVSLPTYMEACHMDSSRTSILQRSQSFPVTAKTPTAVNQSRTSLQNTSPYNRMDFHDTTDRSGLFDMATDQSAIQDVPFVISQGLNPYMRDHIQVVSSMPPRLDYTEFDYDFSLEQHLLQDYHTSQ